jgi:hypothetical protein
LLPAQIPCFSLAGGAGDFFCLKGKIKMYKETIGEIGVVDFNYLIWLK